MVKRKPPRVVSPRKCAIIRLVILGTVAGRHATAATQLLVIRTLDLRSSCARPAGPRGLRGRNRAALRAAVGRGAEVVATGETGVCLGPGLAVATADHERARPAYGEECRSGHGHPVRDDRSVELAQRPGVGPTGDAERAGLVGGLLDAEAVLGLDQVVVGREADEPAAAIGPGAVEPPA